MFLRMKGKDDLLSDEKEALIVGADADGDEAAGGSLEELLSSAKDTAATDLHHRQHQHYDGDDDDDDSSFTLLSEDYDQGVSSDEEEDDDEDSGEEGEGSEGGDGSSDPAAAGKRDVAPKKEKNEEEDDDDILAKKWVRLQSNFAVRERALTRITRGKSRAFVDLLWRHELEVRSAAQERLLVAMLIRERDRKEKEKEEAKGSNNNSDAGAAGKAGEADGSGDQPPGDARIFTAYAKSAAVPTKASKTVASAPDGGGKAGKNLPSPQRSNGSGSKNKKNKKATLRPRFWPKKKKEKRANNNSSISPETDDEGDDDITTAAAAEAEKRPLGVLEKEKERASRTPPPDEGVRARKKGRGGAAASFRGEDEIAEALSKCRQQKLRPNSRSTGGDDDGKGSESEASPFPPPPKSRPSLGAALREAMVFEIFTSVPAIFSIVFFCVAHVGIYQVFSYVIEQLTKQFYSLNSMLSQDLINLAVFFVGFWLTRFSGYLYWFLSPSDYECVKFDFHNRLRLGKWDARCLRWVVGHDVARATLFTAGYYLCYIAVDYFHGRFVDAFFNEREALLGNLPSRQYDLHVSLDDLPPEVPGAPISFSCQHEMDKLEERHEELKEADVWYTYSVLSTNAYENYWYGYNEGMNAADTGALTSANTEFFVCVGSIVISIAALSAYGFSFWYKY